MNTLLIIILIIASLILFLKIWNILARQYNYKILRNSHCQNCDDILGPIVLVNAIQKVEKEKDQLKTDAKIGAVTLHTMKLICLHCGTENSERDLYDVNRKNRNKK